MSENEMSGSEQDATPAAPSESQPQKKVSGLLIFSIVLTLSGIWVVPLIGTVAGLICAVKGRKKVMADPLLIGPRFAMFCIIAAVLSIPVSGWQMSIFWDAAKKRQESGAAIEAALVSLRTRDYEKVWSLLDESYRQEHTLEEFTATMQAAFPGTEPLILGEETLAPRTEKLAPEAEAALVAYYQEDAETLDFTYEVMSAEAGGRVNLDIRLKARRLGWAEYDAKVFSLHAWLEPESPKDLEVPDLPVPAEPPAKEASAEDEPK